MPIITEAHVDWAKDQIKVNVTKHVYKSTYSPYVKGGRKKHSYYDYGEPWDEEDGVTVITPTESVVAFSAEDESLIDIAAKSFAINRSTIEDLVDMGWTVSEAIDLLLEDVLA